MKKRYLILILAVILGAGCKKDAVPPAPKADFTIDSKTAATITVPQDTHLLLSSSSENSVSYLWDFGDGTSSTEQQLIHRFDKAGVFNVSLTVKSFKGQTSSVKKQVKVLAPVINTVSITSLTALAYGLDSDVPKLDKADVWIEIRKSAKGFISNEDPDPTGNVSLVYKSPVLQNATPLSTATFDVGSTLLDLSALNDNKYLITLYAKDQTGKTYRLFNNRYSGSNEVHNGSIETNSFLLNSAFAGYAVEFRGKFQ